MEHILFLTGHLAKPSLERVLAGIDAAPFTWETRDYRCVVDTWFPREGDGHALLSLTQSDSSRWQLDVWFDKGFADIGHDHRRYELG